MEWIERLNEAIGYLEEIACCSAYHFQRMFSFMAGIPLSEYIRRRKMSLAAVDLQGKEMKIIDVAAKYGYSSPQHLTGLFSLFTESLLLP